MKIDARIREAIESGETAADAAEAALKGATRAELAELAHEQVHERAREILRASTLWAERRVERDGRQFYQAVIGSDPLTVGTCFYVEGHGICYWATATAEQHELRATSQRRLAATCIEDAERHAAAAEMIRKAKVECLADLQAVAVAA